MVYQKKVDQIPIRPAITKTASLGPRATSGALTRAAPASGHLVRGNKVGRMYSSFRTGQRLGLQTLDQFRGEVVGRNVISASDARMRAVSKEMFGAA